MTDAEFWQAIIAALLALVSAIERWRGIEPTTRELRKRGKDAIKAEANEDAKSKAFFRGA